MSEIKLSKEMDKLFDRFPKEIKTSLIGIIACYIRFGKSEKEAMYIVLNKVEEILLEIEKGVTMDNKADDKRDDAENYPNPICSSEECGEVSETWKCPVCRKEYCEECRDEIMIYDEYEKDWFCKSCEAEYNKERTWEFVTKADDKIHIEHGFDCNNKEYYCFNAPCAKLRKYELETFTKRLKEIQDACN